MSIYTNKIKWFNPDDEDIKQLSKELCWNKCADIIREKKIYYTGMTVTEILSDKGTFSESEIDELKKKDI